MSIPSQPRLFAVYHPNAWTLSDSIVVADGQEPPGPPFAETTLEDLVEWCAAERTAGWVPQRPSFLDPVPVSASRESILIELALATVSEALPSGITDTIIAAQIASIPDPLAQYQSRLEFQRPTWRRGHPMIGQIGSALTPPISSDGIDEIFRRAAARDATPL